MWSFLLPVAGLDIGSNHMIAVVQAIFRQDGWQRSNRLQNALELVLSFFFVG
jgi:hypothetical protein